MDYEFELTRSPFVLEVQLLIIYFPLHGCILVVLRYMEKKPKKKPVDFLSF